jgi:hypothetical protein
MDVTGSSGLDGKVGRRRIGRSERIRVEPCVMRRIALLSEAVEAEGRAARASPPASDEVSVSAVVGWLFPP